MMERYCSKCKKETTVGSWDEEENKFYCGECGTKYRKEKEEKK